MDKYNFTNASRDPSTSEMDKSCIHRDSASDPLDAGSGDSASNHSTASMDDDLLEREHRADSVYEFTYHMKFTESINSLIRLGNEGQLSKKNQRKWQNLCKQYMDLGSELYKNQKINLDHSMIRKVDDFYEFVIREIKSNPKSTAEPSQEHYQILFREFMDRLENTECSYDDLKEEYRKRNVESDIHIPFFERKGFCKSNHFTPHCKACGWPGLWVKNFEKRGIYVNSAKHWTDKNVWFTGVNPQNEKF